MSAAVGTVQKPMVSIIVPVFNVSPYLREGLESLLAQDFSRPCEIILIDDCSTDDSLAICREFAGKHPQTFCLIESAVNGGVSVARNTGLEHARGCYLMFFDPDDTLPETALSQLYQAAEQYAADIVKGNLVLFNDAERRPAPDRVQRTELVSGEAVLTTLFEHARVRGHIGGKLFRRDKFAALRFTVGVRMAQDLLFFSEMFAAADSLLLLAGDVYCYRKHPHGSTGGKYERGSYIDWMGAVEQSGKFASGREQTRAHRSLLLRTMTQIARECRKIEPASAAPVLGVIEEKCAQWNIRLSDLLVGDKLPLRDIGRYVKLRMALRQIRRNLAHS
ncbi:MAG: glycosyltransferase family 2 protein [Gammaproteobacteria bacterium]|nr:glycosyltransferase family 2 protein [Gammaproteobacteria bacterium]